jgi:hypothetical protein
MNALGIKRLGVCLVVLVTTCLACTTSNPPPQKQVPLISFYEWSSTPDISREWIAEFKPKRLYIKTLDFAHKDDISLSKIQMPTLPHQPLVPVVFIDNRLLNTYPNTRFIKQITEWLAPSKYASIQIDCDWTPSTRAVYFELLKVLSERYTHISATIRLHQVKYFKKTGVPPVQRGLLMYYNMSKLKDFATKNYILDLEVGRKYHYNFDAYPLPLDLGLPLYRQVRVFRHESLVGLIDSEGLNQEHLKASPSQRDTVFTVTQSHYASGHFLYEGDQLKLDRVTVKDLTAAIKSLRLIMKPEEIIFFDRHSTQYFEVDTLKQLAGLFGD